jgi:hypothetical protein
MNITLADVCSCRYKSVFGALNHFRHILLPVIQACLNSAFLIQFKCFQMHLLFDTVKLIVPVKFVGSDEFQLPKI